MPIEITQTVSGYHLHFPDQNLTITVYRIYLHKEGDVSGIITIDEKRKDGDYTLLPLSKFNFSSDSTRARIAKNLTEKNEKINWAEILDMLCQMVQKKALEGDPGEIIETDDSEITPPVYLLEPVIMKSVPSVIYGDKGVHKTILSLFFACCVSLPWDDNPLGLTTTNKPSKVAYLDWESDRDLTKYNVQRLRKGMDAPYFNFAYRRCKMPLSDDVDQISNFLEKNKSDLIMVDSVGLASGGDLTKPEIAIKFFESLRLLGRTSLLIGQNAKNEEGKKSMFGSTFWEYCSRNIFELRKAKEGISPDETSVALFHKESNYSGKYDAQGFHLYFTKDSIKIENETVDYAEFVEKINRQKQALELLKRGALTTEEIKEGLGITRANTDQLLKRLRAKTLITKNPDGKWGLLLTF